jgi:protein O-GlcNAc transferase
MLDWLKQTLSRRPPPPATAGSGPSAEALARKSEADRLSDAGDVDAARRAYLEAVALAPDYAQAWNNLALSYLQTGALAEAEDALRHAVDAMPGLVAAWVNLASVQEARGDAGAAEESLVAALAADPVSLAARNNLGTIVCAAGRFIDAEEHFRAALAQAPGDAGVRSNLALALRGQGRIDDALEVLRDLPAQPEPGLIEAYLLTLNYADRVDAAFVAAEHRRLGAQLQGAMHPAPIARPRENARPLRVGYVSADFGFHVVSFFLEPVLAAHDRSVVEVFCYFSGTRHDAQTARTRSHAAGWRDIGGVDDATALEIIRADRLDIAVDLSGHTGGHRLPLFAQRIAPVQVTWLGYPNTTGVPAMDFRLTDAWADPPGMTERLHTETLVRLPSGFLAYQPRPEAPEVAPPPFRTRGHVTFGCFSNPAKLSDTCLALWAHVLNATPGSRLLVKARGLEDTRAEARFRARFAAAGGAAARLDISGWEGDFETHLQRYADVDIALDSHPYHGTTTTCEALWMGVPVVTLAGDAHVSRVGASLLARAGHPEWVASDRDDHVRIASDLAADREALANHRHTLRSGLRTSALTNVGQLARALEAAYADMHARRCGP